MSVLASSWAKLSQTENKMADAMHKLYKLEDNLILKIDR